MLAIPALAVWIAQGSLAIAFLLAGAMKSLAYPKARAQITWVAALPETRVRTIGTLEMFGAVGVVLPSATGILPWLTPLAAIGLALVMVAAFAFHLPRGEHKEMVANVVLFVFAGIVAGLTYATL